MKTASVGHPPRKSKISRRFTIITVMFLSVLIGLLIYTIATIQKEKSNAILIDIAGRQRMLSQKHMKEVFLTSQGVTADYASTRELFRSTLHALMEGGSVVLDPATGEKQTIPAVPSEEILLKLGEQQKHFEEIIELGDDLLLLPLSHPEFRQKLKLLRSRNSTLIAIADDAVKQLDRYSESNMTTMVWWESIIALFVGLLGTYITRQGIRDGRKIEKEILERQRAEEKLRSTEELYRQILDSIPDMVLVKDLNFQIFWANKAFRSYYNMTNEELKGLLDSRFNKPEFTKRYNEDDSYVFNTGKILDIPEEPVTRHDGQVAIFHTIKAPLFNENGEVVQSVGVSRDITERKQAELERAEGELLLRLIFETGPGCIKRLAADGTLLHMNPAGLKLIEAEQETEALGLSVFDLIAPEHLGAFQQMHHKVMQGTKETLQFEIQGLRGGRRWMETYAVPFHNPITNAVEHLAVTHDITKRKKAEDVFRRGERKFRAIYEQAPTGIAILDSYSSKFTQINQKYCDITGYSQEEMRDRTFKELTHPDDLQADLDYMQQLLTEQITSFRMEKRYIRKTGEIIWVNLTCVPLWLEPSDHRQHIAMVEDITYRKQAEQALQESEERYRTLYEDNPSMYFTVAQDGKILSVNQFGAQQLQYSVEELIGLPVIDLFLEDDQYQVQQHFESCLRKPLTVFSWEYRKVRKDGSVLWVKEAARAVHNKEKEIVVLIVCEDISERKESDKALQEWKALTESILGQLPKGFAYRCLNEKIWTIIYASDGIEEVTGYPVADLLSGSITYDTLMAPGENERVWPIVQDALAKGIPYENEHQIITRDGTTKWILARGRFIFDDAGQLLYLDGLNVDITEQKQIEKALRTSETRFRSLIEHVPFGIHEIDLSGTITSMNKSGQKMMGIENESQVIGHSYLKFTEEKDHDRIRDFFEQALQGQPVVFEINETTHGKIRYFSKSFVPIRGREETVLKIVGVSEEITERKEAEKQLLDSESKRIEAFRQSDDLKSALLASVSHELRTPLTAMKGSISSIMGNSSTSKDQKREDALKGVDREINYMSHLVDNLLDMSQIEAGKLMPHKEWHLLEDLTEGALRRVAQTLDTRNIEIYIPEDVPPIFVDAVEIQQVLMNLIDNAVKYSLPHSPIHLLARIDPQQIEVVVSNTGEPIQAQDLERIFERFYRGRLPREEPIRGTGLGLAICKGIIEAHGGRIWAESVGKEVTITFTIPTTDSMADFSLEGLHKR